MAVSKSLSNILILDHHPSVRPLNFNKSTIPGNLIEVNPNYFGIDGSHEISGGGISYLLAKTFGHNHLSWLGVLSGVGDMQNTHTGKFMGLNRNILEESSFLGQVNYTNDLSIYGRQTRPLFVALSFAETLIVKASLIAGNSSVNTTSTTGPLTSTTFPSITYLLLSH